MNATDFRSLFEAIPGLHIVLSTDFKIAAVSNAYVEATMKKREELLDRVFFEVFPDNPEHVKNNPGYSLRTVLQKVLDEKKTVHTPLRKYNTKKPDGTIETSIGVQKINPSSMTKTRYTTSFTAL